MALPFVVHDGQDSVNSDQWSSFHLGWNCDNISAAKSVGDPCPFSGEHCVTIVETVGVFSLAEFALIPAVFAWSTEEGGDRNDRIATPPPRS